MGIPKYHKWLTDRYPEAFAEAGEESADHVYVDVNTLLHHCMRHSQTEEQFFNQLFQKFDGMFRVVVPKKSVFLAVDGPASCAKCLTQRTRRRAHAQKDAKMAKKGSKGKGKGKGKWDKGGKGGASQLSNNMLTPGVPFMTQITKALEYYAASRMAPNGVFSSCSYVVVSGGAAIGEGEHKIVSQMLRVAACASGESHVIFSGDADIFLLSVVQSACRRVRVVSEREDPQVGAKRRRMMLQIWNAEVLARYLHGEIGRNLSSLEEAAIRRDFALVSLLAGNDYLPEMRCSLSPQKLWEKYLDLRQNRFPDQSLLNATDTDEGLPASHLEGGWACEVGELGAAFTVEPYQHLSFDQEFFLALMRAAAGGSPGSAALGDEKENGVLKYLQGLLWILEMYHHGYCGDFYFVFEKSKHFCASASLIAQFLANAGVEDGVEAEIVPSRTEVGPMKPLTCALCILPVTHAESFLCGLGTAPTLKPMLQVDHPLLGSVNSIERSEALQECKGQVTRLQQEMMSLRSLGRDDTKVKAMLTAAQQQMMAIKEGGTDIDVVPLQEVDAEVVERVASKKPQLLEFGMDVTFVREAGSKPLSVTAPTRSMRPFQGNFLLQKTGEWPRSQEASTDVVDCGEVVEDIEEDQFGEEVEDEGEFEVVGEEVAEETWDAEEEPSEAFEVGAEAEVYWPDDDTWLPGTVEAVHADGSMAVVWDADGSQSDVPADYVRSRPIAEGPPAKRKRV